MIAFASLGSSSYDLIAFRKVLIASVYNLFLIWIEPNSYNSEAFVSDFKPFCSNFTKFNSSFLVPVSYTHLTLPTNREV